MPTRRTFLAAAASGLVAVRTVFARDLAQLRGLPGPEDYTLDPKLTYLNHGSVGTIPKLVQEARAAYLATCESNPARYMWEEPWLGLREDVRRALASFLTVPPRELAITHNTTEGFNLLAQGLPLGKGDEVLFSSLNHPGASVCWRHRSAARGFAVREFEFPIERVREITAARFVELHVEQVRPQTKVLVLPHIDNIVGVQAPLQALCAAVKDKGVQWVAVDGAQAVGMVPVDLAASGVDFYGASPHKWLQAPKGLGLFWLRSALIDELRPMWVTWGQRRWQGTARVFEDYGTRNLPEVLALGDAVAFHRRTSWREREMKLRKLWRAGQGMGDALREQPGMEWLSPVDWQIGSSLFSLRVKGPDARARIAKAAESGFVFRVFGGERVDFVRLSPNVANSEEDMVRVRQALFG